MLPKVEIEIGTEAEEVVQPSLTWKLDFEKNQVTTEMDGIEAIKQSVYMILLTERYRYLIYSWNYGIELDDLIGKDYDYVQSELQRRIIEALLQDDRIEGVENFQVEFSGNVATVKFTVISSLGSYQEEMMVNV